MRPYAATHSPHTPDLINDAATGTDANAGHATFKSTFRSGAGDA
jgi:hypothetical protein